MDSKEQGCPACAKNITAQETKVGEVELLCETHTAELNSALNKLIGEK